MSNSSGGNGPAFPNWLRPAIFVGGAAVLLGVGYFIGATFFAGPQSTPVAEAPVELTRTLIPTFTPSPVPPTATATALPTNTSAPVVPTPVPSVTPILVVVTAEASATPLPTNTPLPPTATAPSSANDTTDPTATPTWTPTLLATATWTPLATPTWTPLATSTWTPIPTATATLLPTATSTATVLPTATATATLTPTATATPTMTPTMTSTMTPTATATDTATLAPTATDTAIPTATLTATATATESATVAPTATATATLTPTASAEPTATETASAEPTATSTATEEATATETATTPATKTATATPTPTPTATETATKTPTATPTATTEPTAAWLFASEPPIGAYLNQPYTYTVTFAPLDVAGTPEDGETAEEEASADATPESLPAEEVVTPPATDESTAQGDAGSELTVDATAEVGGDESGEVTAEAAVSSAETEPAAPEPVESLPFAVTANGTLTVEVPVRPLWLALTTLDGGAITLVGTPLAEDEGEHPVVLIATDAAGVVITQSYTITAELDPNPFRLEPLSFETDEDTPLEGILTAGHVEGAELTFGVESEPENGAITAIDEATGAFTYEPLPDFAGDDVFTIHISDTLAREVTAPVTITVNANNDAPVIELEEVYTVTVGESVEVPVTVTDIDSELITVTVEALPPDLLYVDDVITGVVAENALDGSPYLAVATAEDADGEVTTYEFTWVMAPVELEEVPAGQDEAGVEPTPEGGDEGSVSGEQDNAGGGSSTDEGVAAVTLTAAAAQSVPGVDGWSTYGWQAPVDFGDCPVVADIRTPAPLDASADLFAEASATEPAGAPMLSVAVDLAAGDYALLVCGCAPTYSDGERTSAPDANQALFAGVDGVTYLSDTGESVPVSGFAGTPGFTWQLLPATPGGDGTPAVFTVAADGPHTVDLWMADDGVLVSSVQVVPASLLAEASAVVGQSCAANE